MRLAPPKFPEVLEGKVISWLTAIFWPSKSSDMSCLDYWFWGVTMVEITRAPPRTLTALKRTVEAFAESLDREEEVQSALHNRKRAQAYWAVGDASF